MAPHSGQSSQLIFDGDGRNAQFLAAVTRSGLDLIGAGLFYEPSRRAQIVIVRFGEWRNNKTVGEVDRWSILDGFLLVNTPSTE